MVRRLLITLCCAALFLSGCLFRRGSPALPVGGSIVRDQLVIYSDFDLPQRHRLIEELVALRGDITTKLQLPTSDEPIHIYLFDTAKRYRSFMKKHYSDFADRRAFFVQDDTKLTVYAYWGDRVAEDLRHEVAHGYLHAVIPNLPLWIDEGLAEYFEVPRGQRGVNLPHADMLIKKYKKDEWTPSVRRLEHIQHAADMTQMEYAESWLWVHLMLESTPDRISVVQQNLNRLRSTGSAPPISDVLEKMETSTERSVIRHLKSVVGEEVVSSEK